MDLGAVMKRLFCCIMMMLVLATSFSCLCPLVSASVQKEDNAIYFSVPTTGENAWGDFDTVYCHIWRDGGDEFFTWQTTFEKCTKVKGNLWKYDLADLENSRNSNNGIEKDAIYAVIFSNNLGEQTYDLYFTTECIGDTVICSNDTKDNPVDPAKKCLISKWTNNSQKYNPVDYYNQSKNPPDKEVIEDESPEENTLSQDMSITIIVILSIVIILLAIILVVKNIKSKKNN